MNTAVLPNRNQKGGQAKLEEVARRLQKWLEEESENMTKSKTLKTT